jgi:hypothetical protein
MHEVTDTGPHTGVEWMDTMRMPNVSGQVDTALTKCTVLCVLYCVYCTFGECG